MTISHSTSSLNACDAGIQPVSAHLINQSNLQSMPTVHLQALYDMFAATNTAILATFNQPRISEAPTSGLAKVNPVSVEIERFQEYVFECMTIIVDAAERAPVSDNPEMIADRARILLKHAVEYSEDPKQVSELCDQQWSNQVTDQLAEKHSSQLPSNTGRNTK